MMMKNRNQSYEALREAARVAGSQAAVAALCGKKQPHFQQWLRSHKGVPAEYCMAIEKGTGVTCEQLRPDLADQWQFLRSTGRQAP